MIKAPRNHTSIYLSGYLKDNWNDFNKFMTAKGFISFNGYANNVFTHDFNNNFAKILNSRNVVPAKRINVYDDTTTMIKEKFNSYTDGEILDLMHMITDLRNVIIQDASRRGIKL